MTPKLRLKISAAVNRAYGPVRVEPPEASSPRWRSALSATQMPQLLRAPLLSPPFPKHQVERQESPAAPSKLPLQRPGSSLDQAATPGRHQLSLLDQGEFRGTAVKMRPCKDNRMNHDEAEELGSEDGDPDRPEEIGNQPSPPRVEYLQYATSTDQRTQGGGGCSKQDASLKRRPPQTATTLL